jgi:3D (Asp-Asp-Asp) domain-containing protein
MSQTQLKPAEVQTALHNLGYYDGAIDGNLSGADFRADLRRFQGDYHLNSDGWYGPITEGKLLPLSQAFSRAAPKLGTPSPELRRWRLTTYGVADQSSYGGSVDIPVYTPKMKPIAYVEAAFFAAMSLEGTGKLRDGRILNVAGDGSAASPTFVACNAQTFAPVFDIAKRNGWIPDKPGYAGILSDGTKATKCRTFEEIQTAVTGYPTWNGIAAAAFKTLAADIGRVAKSDPQWKGKGGVAPVGTRVYILECDGLALPSGSFHDGWFTVNDCGGGIFGAHFDVFVGAYTKAAKATPIPSLAHVWFPGIENKLSMNYSYGL